MEGESYVLKNKAINDMLKEHNDKSAHYTCAIAFVNNQEGIEKVFEGKVFGTIIEAIEGPHGFGYDPIFYSFEAKTCFGTASEDIKNKYSHRAKALEKFIEYFKNK